MKSLEKSKKSKSFGPVATVTPPVLIAMEDMSPGAVTQPANVDDLAVLKLGEPMEFSRDCWIAAIQDLAAESRLMPAPNNAPVSQGASPWQEAPAAVSPAEQLTAFELETTKAQDTELKQSACCAWDQLVVQLESEQQSSAQAAHQAAEVTNRLDGLTVELELINAEAAQLRSDRERADSEWNKQLDAARTAAQKLEADRTAAVERSMHLESELEKACCAWDELAVQLESEQQSSAQAAHQAAEVTNRLDGLTVELELINAEAASLRQEREELHTKLVATQLQVGESESRVSDLESRLKEMAEEVQRLSQENAKYKGTLSVDPKLLQGDLYTFETSARKPVRRKSPVCNKRP